MDTDFVSIFYIKEREERLFYSLLCGDHQTPDSEKIPSKIPQQYENH